jgi:hypothetical protein
MFSDCIGKTVSHQSNKQADTGEVKAPRKNIQVDIVLNDPEDKEVQAVERENAESQTNVRELLGNNLETNVNYARIEEFLKKVVLIFI